MEMTFRNAPFGGFNRQDVMDYIAAAAKESGERIAQLEKEVESLEEHRAANEMLKDELEAVKDTCVRLEQELTRITEERDALKLKTADREQLLKEKNAMADKAQEYQDLKQHIAGIELDAHKRADQIVAEAEAKAGEIVRMAEETREEIRREILEELQAVHYAQQELVNTFDTVRTHVTGELRKVDVALSQMPSALQRVTSAVKEMRDKAEERCENAE